MRRRSKVADDRHVAAIHAEPARRLAECHSRLPMQPRAQRDQVANTSPASPRALPRRAPAISVRPKEGFAVLWIRHRLGRPPESCKLAAAAFGYGASKVGIGV